MTSVSQIIPNYFTGGISDQPDELKKPGQLRDCVNAFPSPVDGLVKRPGLELIDQLQNECADQDVERQGSWFHFSRENVSNQAKQDYVGYVSRKGEVSVWRCSDGKSMNVYYTDTEITPNDNEGVALKDLSTCQSSDYLNHNKDRDIKFTTVNNYTFMTNSSKAVTMSKKNNKRPYEAFIEISQLVYAREYLVDIDLVKTDVDSTYKVATEITLSKTSNFGGDNENPTCPANFRDTVTLDAKSGDGKGLIVEIESVGVQESYSNNRETRCIYRHSFTSST